MEIHSVQPSHPGQATTFTGLVWRTPIHEGSAPGFLSLNLIHFTPESRTAWHTHDFGQTLVVVEGEGVVQVRGARAHRLGAGDVVAASPGEEHWHGADGEHFMVHYSLVEGHPDRPAVQWGTHVSDGEYQAALEQLGES